MDKIAGGKLRRCPAATFNDVLCLPLISKLNLSLVSAELALKSKISNATVCFQVPANFGFRLLLAHCFEILWAFTVIGTDGVE